MTVTNFSIVLVLVIDLEFGDPAKDIPTVAVH